MTSSSPKWMIQAQYVYMDDFQQKIHGINSNDCSEGRQMSAKIFKFENIKFCCIIHRAQQQKAVV